MGVRRYFFESGEVKQKVRYRESPKSNTALLASLPFELLYLDLVKMLHEMRVPVARRVRSEEDPIVIVGGPAVIGNPLPIWEIADAIVIGEFEEIAEDLVNAISKPSRHSRLRTLSEIEGVLVPDYTSHKVKRVYVKDLDKSWYPIVQEVSEDVEPIWGRAFILEVSRGCLRRCRFCMEGCIFKPRRDRSLQKLKELLELGTSYNKVNKVSMYSLSFFDSPWGETLLEHAVSLGLEVSLPSLRAETLTEKRAELLVEGGQKTVSIAPETGSFTIARAIMKLTGKMGAIRASEILASAGIRQVKVYLMAGFPGESAEDLKETLDMMLEIRKVLQPLNARVRVSLNPFIPKPSTPLQWFGFKKRRAEKAVTLAKSLRKQGFEIEVYPLDYAELQIALGRADVSASEVLLDVALRGGGYRNLLTSLRERSARALEDWDPAEEPPWSKLIEDNYTDPEALRRELYGYLDVLMSRDPQRVLVAI
ncbi:MAG: radical SAM protein [Acidilobaceae archaeon]